MIAEKEMFEARGETFQHGKRIAVANGGEQAHYTAMYDCMVHGRLLAPFCRGRKLLDFWGLPNIQER